MHAAITCLDVKTETSFRLEPLQTFAHNWTHFKLFSNARSCANYFASFIAFFFFLIFSSFSLFCLKPQCDQIGRFFKVLGYKVSFKCSPNI